MTPTAHTFYTLTLFLALSALKLWSDRHHRIPRACRLGWQASACRPALPTLPQSGQ
jgi:hypothetical protein